MLCRFQWQYRNSVNGFKFKGKETCDFSEKHKRLDHLNIQNILNSAMKTWIVKPAF